MSADESALVVGRAGRSVAISRMAVRKASQKRATAATVAPEELRPLPTGSSSPRGCDARPDLRSGQHHAGTFRTSGAGRRAAPIDTVPFFRDLAVSCSDAITCASLFQLCRICGSFPTQRALVQMNEQGLVDCEFECGLCFRDESTCQVISWLDFNPVRPALLDHQAECDVFAITTEVMTEEPGLAGSPVLARVRWDHATVGKPGSRDR